jgi:hypothetical protein
MGQDSKKDVKNKNDRVISVSKNAKVFATII